MIRKIRDKGGLSGYYEDENKSWRSPHSGYPQQAPGPQDDDGEGPEVLKLLGRVCEQADSIPPCLNPSRD